ncbi:MAG: ATP-binding cassette domain-containing protein [Leucobacter sp.]
MSLSIREGEFVAIVGASGAGKSTLLNLLGLLDSPSAGNYLVRGEPVGALAERERDRLRAATFGFVFQDSHMLAKETAGGNAALGLSINEVDPSLRPGLVARALATVGLLGKAQERAGNLSGGERQRVALARAIATAPMILLADEPTGALDTANSARVVDTFRTLNSGGVTVIMITHDPDVAGAADRVIEMSDGRIVSDSDDGDAARTDVPESSADPAPALPDPAAPVPGPAPAQLPARTQSGASRARERIASAISTHTVHAARAAVLLLAFTIGAGGLVTAIGLNQSAAEQVVGRLDSADLDKFLVVPKQDPDAIRAEFALSEEASVAQVAAIARERLRGLDGVLSVGMTAAAEFDGDVTLLDPATVAEQPSATPEIHLADRTYLEMQGVKPTGGVRSLRLFDSDEDSPAVLIGSGLAEKLGIEALEPGAQLWIGRVPAAIVGVIGDSGEEPRFGSALVVNPALAEEVASADATLLIRTAPGGPAALAKEVGLAIAPGDDELYRPETVADLRLLTEGVASDLVALTGAVSWVLLVLTSLSAATAAYLSVHARSAEIALRRAVGESRRSIWGQFMLEGLTVGLLGGLLGSALGVVLLVAAARTQGWVPTFDLRFLGVGVIAGVLTGALASLYPAAVAARKDPALAVRGT